MKLKNGLYSFFHIEQRGSTIKRELLGGLIVFLAMFYVLPVNTDLMSLAGAEAGAAFLATALSTIIASIIMGTVANYPVSLAPGMGLNAFFTYTVVGSLGFSFGEALASVFISGIIFIIISVTNLRKHILIAIPKSIKAAVGAGIGGFVAFVGLKGAGIIEANPSTIVGIQNFRNPLTNEISWPIILIVGLALLGIVLVLIISNLKSKVRNYAVIISMAVICIISLICKACNLQTPGFNFNDYKLSDLQFDTSIWTGFKTLFTNSKHLALLIPVTFAFLFVEFFDTTGTLLAVANTANLVDEEGNLKDGKKAFVADSIGTIVGAALGTSTVTSYVESTTGVESGARTGLSACFTAFLFVLAILLYPIFSIFGSITVDGKVFSPITSIPLVFVGILMFKQIRNVNFDDMAEASASFIIIIGMILTYSISYGIAFGFLTYLIVMLAQRRLKEIHPALYVLSVIFVSYIILDVFL